MRLGWRVLCLAMVRLVMSNTERRIAALEAGATDDTLKVVLVEDGETQADALKRVGLPPDARRVLYLSHLDARL